VLCLWLLVLCSWLLVLCSWLLVLCLWLLLLVLAAAAGWLLMVLHPGRKYQPFA